LLRPGHDLVQAHGVRVGGVPGEVVAGRALLHRAHAVLPAVAGDEVAARVAHGADPELAGQGEDVGAEAVLIGLGVVRLVDPGVDAAPEVLDEGAEGAAAHGSDAEGGVQGEGDGARHRAGDSQRHRRAEPYRAPADRPRCNVVDNTTTTTGRRQAPAAIRPARRARLPR